MRRRPPVFRRARTRGAGLEFHEYRHYQAGDDPRSIDWTVEARLRQLVVRVSRAEGHLRLHVLIDGSASMGVGTPDKLACARESRQLCVTWPSSAGMPPAVSSFGRSRTDLHAACCRTSATLPGIRGNRVADPSGASSIEHALESYAAAVSGPGLVVVLSDFFEPGAGLRGLQSLLHRNLTPAVVQIVAEEEMHPFRRRHRARSTSNRRAVQRSWSTDEPSLPIAHVWRNMRRLFEASARRTDARGSVSNPTRRFSSWSLRLRLADCSGRTA